jgi:hypothetical protein
LLSFSLGSTLVVAMLRFSPHGVSAPHHCKSALRSQVSGKSEGQTSGKSLRFAAFPETWDLVFRRPGLS